ncbi:MAG: thioesterase family protein [Nonlabens sp.]
MIVSNITIEPRYSETDQMGVVHHANYLIYMELGRLDWLAALGFSYATMESNGFLLPVRKINIDYLKPMQFGCSYQLKTSLIELPTTRVKFAYEITDPTGQICAQANLLLVFTNKTTFRPCRPPQDFLQHCSRLWKD